MEMKRSARGILAVMLSVNMLIMSAAVPAFAEDLIVPEEALEADGDFLQEEKLIEEPDGDLIEGDVLEFEEEPDGGLTEKPEEDLFPVEEGDASPDLTEEAESGADILEVGEGNEGVDPGDDVFSKVSEMHNYGGTVFLEKTEWMNDEKVEFTVTPDEGYLINTIEAYYFDNNNDKMLVEDVKGPDKDGNCSFIMPSYDVQIYVEFEQIGGIINSATASFEDCIWLNFYIEVPDSIKEGAYAKIICASRPDDIAEIPVSTAAQSDDGYKFRFALYPRQIDDDVTIWLMDKNDKVLPLKNKSGTNVYPDGVIMTLGTYLNGMISEGSDSMSKLAWAARDYCYAAKKHFIGQGECPISDAVNGVTADALKDYEYQSEGNLPAGVQVNSMTVMFLTDNSFRLYLKFNEDVDPYSLEYYLDDKKTELRKRQDGWYYLTFDKVTSTMLGKEHFFQIKDSEKTYTAGVSVLTYVRSTILKSTSETMVTLAKALYLYNQEALNYFNNR